MHRLLYNIVAVVGAVFFSTNVVLASLECTVTFRLKDGMHVGTIQWTTDYSELSGFFVGERGAVSCNKLGSITLSQFNDRDDERQLITGLITSTGLTGPVDVTRCIFRAPTAPATASFKIFVSEASDSDPANPQPIDPLPVVVVSTVECEGQANVCGDGQVDEFEQCDDGNTTSSDGCTSECELTSCGDGYVYEGVESCDDANTKNGDGCDSNCSFTGCGNGILTVGEKCDDGNLQSGDGCDSNCKETACGNGVTTAGEACDDGNLLDGDGCDANCKLTGCGNGRLTGGEQCDDGNSSNLDACTNACKTSFCGDGFKRTSVEGCDDGNSVNGDGCDINCTPTSCGNGIATAGEQCDDGNLSTSDSCPECITAHCGDGYRWSGVEECDDGGTINGDGCSSACETQRKCGDATGDGKLLASDALRVLQRAVGLDVDCPTWICDVDGRGVQTSDGLKLLRRSIDLPVTILCGTPSEVVLRIMSSTTLGSLQITVDYSKVSGDFYGAGDKVDCGVLQPGVNVSFNNKPTRKLAASFASLSGIHGPGSLATCKFDPFANVDSNDFGVTIVEAVTGNGLPATKPIVMAIPY